MEILEVNRFCYCINLKAATTFGGFFGSFLDKGVSCLIHHTYAWNFSDDSSQLLIFLYVIISIAFITTVLMITGSALERYSLMRPYLGFYVMDINITSILTYYRVYKLFLKDIILGFMALGLSTLTIAFAIYFWIVVYSRYKEIYREEVEENEQLIIDSILEDI